ncbi:MAG: DUF4105 domain-containing protein [Deltaproteobacteria bacterium]|nr:DUF4105 domain-containing protein [Deltaproteobacteria bacterium]
MCRARALAAGSAFLVLVVLLPRLALSAPTAAELYTMGPGDDAFSKFGHAALCITDDRSPHGRCYNYGTADFTTPVPLAWEVLRGRGRFWVSVTSRSDMLDAYRAGDRTVYKQVLPLSREAADELAARLARDARPENRFYTYHHFKENCATRLRDHIDAVTGGALHASPVRLESTFRDMVRAGFQADPLLLLLSDFLIGRAADLQPNTWEAMFLPEILREEVSRRLGARPEVVFTRKAAESVGAGGWALGGLAFGAMLGAASVAGLRSRRHLLAKVGLVAIGVVLGLTALVVDAVALVSPVRELRGNELLLVLLPTDLMLAFMSSGRGRMLRGYLMARLAMLALVASATLLGLLVQPIWYPLALVLVMLVPVYFRVAGRALAP